MVGGERSSDLDLFHPDRFEPGAAYAENGDYYTRYAARGRASQPD